MEGEEKATMAEWSKAADLRSAIFGCVGSNPTGCINIFIFIFNFALVAQLVRASVL